MYAASPYSSPLHHQAATWVSSSSSSIQAAQKSSLKSSLAPGRVARRSSRSSSVHLLRSDQVRTKALAPATSCCNRRTTTSTTAASTSAASEQGEVPGGSCRAGPTRHSGARPFSTNVDLEAMVQSPRLQQASIQVPAPGRQELMRPPTNRAERARVRESWRCFL